jgi:formate dehydrogenase subunit gamma
MRVLHILLVALLLAAPIAVSAQPAPVPLNDRGQPNAEEIELQKALQRDILQGRVSIPDARAGKLIQPAGKEWRDFHNVTLAWVGGIAVGGMLLVLASFYATRGRIRIEGGPSGRTIQRFNLLERSNHWMVASSFIILGLTGLNLTFGRHLLLPLIGPVAFAEAAHWGKMAHNFLAFPFTLGIVLMLIFWVKDNIPNGRDIDWFRQGGGLIGKGHPKAGRFNGGQKMVFWITVLGGAAVAISGYMLIFPFWGPLTIADMQLAHIVHSVISVLMISAMLGHIYIGSIGMEGAFDAMGSGEVDLAWAKEHHALWVEEEVARARQHVSSKAAARAAGAD